MEKRRVLEQLNKAKGAHVHWLTSVEALVDGAAIDRREIPLHDTECEFGRWYHGTGRLLAGFEPYQAIAEPHKQLHHLYQELFQVLFEEERNLLKRIFRTRSQICESHKEEIEGLMIRLTSASARMLLAISDLEAEVRSLTDQELRSKTVEEMSGLLGLTETQLIRHVAMPHP